MIFFIIIYWYTHTYWLLQEQPMQPLLLKEEMCRVERQRMRGSRRVFMSNETSQVMQGFVLAFRSTAKSPYLRTPRQWLIDQRLRWLRRSIHCTCASVCVCVCVCVGDIDLPVMCRNPHSRLLPSTAGVICNTTTHMHNTSPWCQSMHTPIHCWWSFWSNEIIYCVINVYNGTK